MCEVSPNVNPSTGIYIYISRYFWTHRLDQVTASMNKWRHTGKK
jgi:hypothetical protein